MTGETIVFGICAGVAATLTMDLLAILFRKAGLIAGAKGSWVGRWYLGIARGRLTHANIALAPAQAGEKQAALIGHYLIGVALALAYLVGARRLAIPPDNLIVALAYGLATTVFSWFLVLPSLGFGFMGLKGPPELKLLRSSLINHLAYGFGLWWIAKLLFSF